MKKIFFNYAILFFIGIATFSCDTFEDDNLPDDLQNNPIQTEGDKQSILAGSPALINLLSNDFVGTQASLELVSNPTKGTARVIANGQVLYIPNSDFTSGQDFFNYKISNSSTAQTGTIEINVEQDSSDIPCQSGIMTDFATYYVNGGIVSEVEVNVLINDFFCEDSIDTSTLTVALQGQYGVTSVRNQQLVYSIPDTVPVFDALAQSEQITDYVVYTVYSDGQELGIGLVVINIKNDDNPCISGMQPDFIFNDSNPRINNDGTPQVIDIFNDKVCVSRLDLSTLKIADVTTMTSGNFPIEIGTVELGRAVNNDPDDITVVYTPDINFSGWMFILVEVYDYNGNKYKEAFDVTVDLNGRCKLIVAESQLVYSLSDYVNAIDDIPIAERESQSIENFFAIEVTSDIFANDELCNLTFTQDFQSMEEGEFTTSFAQGSSGTRLVMSNDKIYLVVDPDELPEIYGQELSFVQMRTAYSTYPKNNESIRLAYVGNWGATTYITINQ